METCLRHENMTFDVRSSTYL